MKKTWIFLILICLLAGGLVAPGLVLGSTQEEVDQLNAEIEARQNKIKDIEATIEKYNKNIKQKQTEAVSLKNQMSILDNKIAQTQADIELTEARIDKASLEIEALELNIAEKERVIDKQKKIVAQMVRNIHAEDQKNYLEIMLTNDSFAEFFSEIQYLESVYTDLGQSVKDLKGIRDDLLAKKDQVSDKKLVFENLKKDLEEKRVDLEERTFAKQDLLLMTNASEARYKTLLASLKQEYQAIEGEVRAYEQKVREKLANLEKNDNALGDPGIFYWPVPSHYVTATFHDPDYPYRHVFEHSGVDVRAAQGTPIRAAAAGYVARARRCSSASCYSYTLILHSNDISTLYGHMSRIIVSEDQFVGKGEIIGYSGGTPGTVGAGSFVTGPHLHFEVRKAGIPVNPMAYY